MVTWRLTAGIPLHCRSPVLAARAEAAANPTSSARAQRRAERYTAERWSTRPVGGGRASEWEIAEHEAADRLGAGVASLRVQCIPRLSRRRRFLALSPLSSPPRGARPSRAPLDTRSSDFGISRVYEDHFKAEMRGFPTSHLRASSDAVECNRGQRQVRPQPDVPLDGRPNFL